MKGRDETAAGLPAATEEQTTEAQALAGANITTKLTGGFEA